MSQHVYRNPLQRLLHLAQQRQLPSEALAAIRQLREELDKCERDAIEVLRDAGLSWGDIARPMGITRQALQKRVAGWGPSPDEGPDPRST